MLEVNETLLAFGAIISTLVGLECISAERGLTGSSPRREVLVFLGTIACLVLSTALTLLLIGVVQ